MIPKVQRTAPEKIWLVVSDDAEDLRKQFPLDTEHVMWCSDPALNCSVEYLRSDKVMPLLDLLVKFARTSSERDEVRKVLDGLSDER